MPTAHILKNMSLLRVIMITMLMPVRSSLLAALLSLGRSGLGWGRITAKDGVVKRNTNNQEGFCSTPGDVKQHIF